MTRLKSAVVKALKDAQLKPRDYAAQRLAMLYAERIDSDEIPLEKAGPALLSVLESLGMTPRSRKVARAKEVGSERPKSPLDELRARRIKRDQSA